MRSRRRSPDHGGLWIDRRSFATNAIWCRAPRFAIVATAIVLDRKGCLMFDELTAEMLDLSANVRGYGAATYAASADDPGSCGGCGTIVLCCTCTTLCW